MVSIHGLIKSPDQFLILQQFFTFTHFSLLGIVRRPYAIAYSNANDAGRCCRHLSIIIF
jgi:hypothetical protein